MGVMHHARLAAGAIRPGGQEPLFHQSGTRTETTPCNRNRHYGRDLSRPYSLAITLLDGIDAIHYALGCRELPNFDC